MIAAYFVACLMSLAVSSATGLGVLLMATLFPVMVNVGISRGAAAAICASPAAIILSPLPAMSCWPPKPPKCR
jgi:DcuC family C4-dicarboxylate transporter